MAVPLDGTVALLIAVNKKTIRGEGNALSFRRTECEGRTLRSVLPDGGNRSGTGLQHDPDPQGPSPPHREPAESMTHATITGEAPILLGRGLIL